MESLLPYYERELTHLRRLSHDFAKRYPKVAGRLLLSGETCDDPNIERLIESFAFLAGRIHKKLDDDYPEFTNSLLQVIYPQYLRPFPSVSIACFEPLPAAAESVGNFSVPRHTSLNTRPVRGVPCHFRTAYEVEVSALRVQSASFENAFDTSGLSSALIASAATTIRICLTMPQADAGTGSSRPTKLRFFLNGEPSIAAALREAILSRVSGIWISNDVSTTKVEMFAEAITAVGFDEDDSLLDDDARCHPAHQLLLEYFAFPEKFNFFDLDLSGVWDLIPAMASRIDLRFGLPVQVGGTNDHHLLERVSKENFVLHCTPVVNLFRRHAEPIRMTETVSVYPIVVDNRQPRAYEVYAIDRVFKVRQDTNGEEIDEYRPFYSTRHVDPDERPVRYWHAEYSDMDADFNVSLSLVDSMLAPDRAETNTISLNLVCTNRDLPSQLPFGLRDGDLFVEGGSSAYLVHMLRKPTSTHRFPRGRGAQWRLVSHLALNHFSLAGSGADVLKEILSLYDIAGAPAGARQIQGIHRVEHQSGVARMPGKPFPVFVKGVDIRLTVDETHYAGIGLFSFSRVLEQFFALYVHTNSFTRLTVISRQTGKELVQCLPRNGASILA
ncbi:type VI secretion system baseplate subunit TssF [Noviherbaspirillum saxi]|nr:type VI secretion system baseplate subunit TssF [Noviherbaspirillum saxi]